VTEQPDRKDGVEDLRESLPEFITIMRSSRFKPYAFIKVMALGARRGLAISRGLDRLRRSYFLSLVLVGLVQVGQLAALALATRDRALLIGPAVVSVLWFALGSLLVCSQLNLVRKPDGRLYDRFGIPNTLTLYRFLSIPLLVALLPVFPQDRGVLGVGMVLFALMAVSDIADGNYARLTSQVSEFGRIYDPICDIAMNAGVCLGAWAAGYLPGWYTGLAEARFFLPLIGGAWVYAYRKPWRIRPTLWGKTSVFVYDVLIGLLLIREFTGEPFMEDLTTRVLWVSGLLFAFNIVTIVDKGMSMVVSGDQDKRGENEQ